MDQLWNIIDGTRTTGGFFTPESILLSLLLAFVLGQILAWVYYFTHAGLSYSKSFVQSLILIAIVVAIIMTVIGNNISTHQSHNGFLRFCLSEQIDPKHPIIAVLKRFCSSFTLISSQGSSNIEYAYQLMIRNAKTNEKMLSELKQIKGVENINLVMQETLLEV